MRTVAALCLAGLLVIGGCPSPDVPSAVTVLTAGTYSGTLDCTTTTVDSTGTSTTNQTSPMTIEVTDAGQLYISGLPYYEGVQFEDSDSASGVSASLTINTITEDAATKTVTIAGTGTTSNPQRTYNTTHDIVLVQTDDTNIEVTDVYQGQTSALDASFELRCGGTVTR